MFDATVVEVINSGGHFGVGTLAENRQIIFDGDGDLIWADNEHKVIPDQIVIG
jgi:hypothetical protein